MRKTLASKECHESCLERLYSLKEVRERAFPADSIADQQREKIDGFIRPEASAHQAHEARAKASSSPVVARCWAMITTSANQAGTEGRLSEVVWISMQGLDTINRETSFWKNDTVLS